MNNATENTLISGADIYNEIYIKTGRVPSEDEIRAFMAILELLLYDDRTLELVRSSNTDPVDMNRPEVKQFYKRAVDNFKNNWDGQPVMTHEQICKGIDLYRKGLLQTAI